MLMFTLTFLLHLPPLLLVMLSDELKLCRLHACSIL
jgi:hypothetical protein